MDARLPVEIVERRPDAVYRGTVYDQKVLVRVGGWEFEVFDADSLVTPEMVGTKRDIDLTVWLSKDSSILPDEQYGVESIADDWHLTVRGKLVSDELLALGDGTVSIETSELPAGVRPGEFVELYGAAPYLIDVEGSRDFDKTYAFFLERLRDDDPEIRAEAARYLGEKGSERCLDPMISTLEDDPIPSVRASAAMALGVVGASACNSSRERDPRIKESLRRAQDDDAEAVREAAEEAMEVCEAPEAASALVLEW